MITATGALTMVGLNTAKPTVFWNGGIVPGIVGIKVDWEDDEQVIKLKVDGTDNAIYAELLVAGIHIKRASK